MCVYCCLFRNCCRSYATTRISYSLRDSFVIFSVDCATMRMTAAVQADCRVRAGGKMIDWLIRNRDMIRSLSGVCKYGELSVNNGTHNISYLQITQGQS